VRPLFGGCGRLPAPSLRSFSSCNWAQHPPGPASVFPLRFVSESERLAPDSHGASAYVRLPAARRCIYRPLARAANDPLCADRKRRSPISVRNDAEVFRALFSSYAPRLPAHPMAVEFVLRWPLCGRPAAAWPFGQEHSSFFFPPARRFQPCTCLGGEPPRDRSRNRWHAGLRRVIRQPRCPQHRRRSSLFFGGNRGRSPPRGRLADTRWPRGLADRPPSTIAVYGTKRGNARENRSLSANAWCHPDTNCRANPNVGTPRRGGGGNRRASFEALVTGVAVNFGPRDPFARRKSSFRPSTACEIGPHATTRWLPVFQWLPRHRFRFPMVECAAAVQVPLTCRSSRIAIFDHSSPRAIRGRSTTHGPGPKALARHPATDHKHSEWCQTWFWDFPVPPGFLRCRGRQ